MTTVVLNDERIEYKVSLSRVGSQGKQGDSVTRAYFDSNNHLMIEVSDAAGNVVRTLDAGDIDTNFDINDLNVFDTENEQDGEVLAYSAESNTFTNHRLTTSNLGDVDNTNRQDGSILVYRTASSKYVATTNLDSAGTTITGGSF